MFSCNWGCRLIFLHGCSRTYRVASLRAWPVGGISYNLYFDCKHVRYVTCDLINEYTFDVVDHFRLVSEEKVFIYHNLENARVYQGNESVPIDIDPDVRSSYVF